MRLLGDSKWTMTAALCGISFTLAIASSIIPKLWNWTPFRYAEAAAKMRQQAPTDRQVLHAWPKGVCPSGYVLQPNMFELRGRYWDGCYRPGTWTPHLNPENGLMELNGSADFLLHLEVMRTPFALTPRK